MLDENGTRPVHFPADPDRFQFDGEVARIFPDMAARSIPNFHKAHEAHAAIAKLLLPANSQHPLRVLDVGASRGHFLKALYSQFRTDEVHYVAVDSSKPMCQYLSAEYPTNIEVHHLDVTGPDFAAMTRERLFDAICVNYVLQFLPVDLQYAVLHHLIRLLRPGGVLFLGHKSHHSRALGHAAHELYIRWRMENGYSREEVEAKTQALKGSMVPMDHQTVLDFLTTNGMTVQETTRFLMFSTLAAMKN